MIRPKYVQHQLNRWRYLNKHLLLAINSYNTQIKHGVVSKNTVMKYVRKMLPLCLRLQRYGINVHIENNL